MRTGNLLFFWSPSHASADTLRRFDVRPGDFKGNALADALADMAGVKFQVDECEQATVRI